MRLKNLLKHRQDSVRILALEALVVLAQKGQAQALFDGKVFFFLFFRDFMLFSFNLKGSPCCFGVAWLRSRCSPKMFKAVAHRF